jgi:hypothetical protein
VGFIFDMGNVLSLDVDVLPPQTAGLVEPVPAEPNQISIKHVDAAESLQSRPVKRNRVLEVSIFEELLPLENHRDARRGENH